MNILNLFKIVFWATNYLFFSSKAPVVNIDWSPAVEKLNCFENHNINSCQPSFLTFVSYLTQVLGKPEDDKIKNNQSIIVEGDDDYDFIIVGAGSAGCVVANRLSEISDWKKSDGVPDLQMHYVPIIENVETNVYESRYGILAYYNKLRMLPTLIAPKSRGNVELNPKDSVYEKPIIKPNFFQDPTDMRVLIEGLKIANKITETMAFKNSSLKFERTPALDCEPFLDNEDKYYECVARRHYMSFYHPVGTCKMGPKSDRDAVVDPRLKVYGITGLRVVDGSIMPKIIRGNINAPIIMIGEKASDMIKQDWKVLQ